MNNNQRQLNKQNNTNTYTYTLIYTYILLIPVNPVKKNFWKISLQFPIIRDIL
jgi:hypothetical protein